MNVQQRHPNHLFSFPEEKVSYRIPAACDMKLSSCGPTCQTVRVYDIGLSYSHKTMSRNTFMYRCIVTKCTSGKANIAASWADVGNFLYIGASLLCSVIGEKVREIEALIYVYGPKHVQPMYQWILSLTRIIPKGRELTTMRQHPIF